MLTKEDFKYQLNRKNKRNIFYGQLSLGNIENVKLISIKLNQFKDFDLLKTSEVFPFVVKTKNLDPNFFEQFEKFYDEQT